MIKIKRLNFRYDLASNFHCSVTNHRFTLKCLPQNTARQKIEDIKLFINGVEYRQNATDSFGNSVVYGCISEPHDKFVVSMTGTAFTGLDIFEEFQPDETKSVIFKYPTPLTTPGKGIENYFKSLELEKFPREYEKVLHIMRELHKDFAYKKGETTVSTAAEEAFNKGCGVCQDYAQIMTALCRMAKIPVRYVTGAIIGEGYSHAWVEALCNGFWYGFDPTNDLLVNNQYIKISHGRDYSDCVINKGIFNGYNRQELDVNVSINDEQ